MIPWAKLAVAGLVAVIIVLVVAIVLELSDDDGKTRAPAAATAAGASGERNTRLAKRLEAQENLQRQERRKRRQAEARERAERGEASITGGGEPREDSATGKRPVEGATSFDSSFAQLESEVSGTIGVAYSLQPGEANQLGSLAVGHAWSSFKVPIVVTLMREQNETLTSSQQGLAAAAITASDNSAAASLFADLDAESGNAEAALERVLGEAGAPTPVATAPPPPGAVSSWGQTEWPLTASTAFYGALACDAYGSRTRSLALGDMENVISEQQWGLGQAAFPSGTQVAIKAGWGPDGSESGPYLVRQAGIINSADGQLVVTIAAQDSSGSFEAGVADLNRVADWVAANLPITGSC